jgi:hypothetical protein
VSDGAAPLWSDDQRDWLQALGHVVYDAGGRCGACHRGRSRQVAAGACLDDAARRIASLVRGRCAGAGSRFPSCSRRTAGTDDGTGIGRRASRRRHARRPAARLPDRLQIALLRASGCNPNLPETQALMDSWPLAELRGNPPAKRALWPQLRALRRAAGRGVEA